MEISKTFPRLFGLLLALVVSLAVQGCALIGSPPTPTPTPEVSAREIANRTSQEMLAVETLHFIIALSGRLAYIDSPPTTALKSIQGELFRPDKLKALVRVSSFGIVAEVGLISIKDISYVTNPLNQRWEKLPSEWGWFFDPQLPFDETYGIPAVVPHIDLEKVGVEEIDEEFFYHLQGVAQGEQITGWTAGLINAGDVPVDLWINTETFLIHRVHMVELGSNADNPTEWDITFFNFDQPVEVEAPPLDQ